MKGHEPVAIANYFLNQHEEGLTLMQLLKLSYMSHGACLSVLNKPLSNEPAQAWQFGPVFPSIYTAFKHYPQKAKENTLHSTETFDNDEKQGMDVAFKRFGHLDGWQLSQLTHNVKSAWHYFYYEANPCGKNVNGVVIPDEATKKFFDLGYYEPNE